MQINKTDSQELLIIKQLNEDLQALKSTVTVPEDTSKVTITTPTAIPGVVDTDSDTEVVPNTTVKVSFEHSGKQQQVTFNYRRLKYDILKQHAGSLDTEGKGYEYKALLHNGTEAVDNTQALVSGLATALNLNPNNNADVEGVSSNLVDGTGVYKLTAKGDSLLYSGEVQVTVQIRDENTGYYVENSESKYFSSTQKLTGVTTEHLYLPAALTEIAESAYANNTLMAVSLPKAVAKIGANAFANSLPSLDDVVLPKTVTEVGANAFQGATSNKVTIPDTITTIGEGAFGTARNTHVSSLAQLKKVLDTKATGEVSTYHNDATEENGKGDSEHALYGSFKIVKQDAVSTIYYAAEDLKAHELQDGAFTANVSDVVLPTTVTELGNVFANVHSNTVDLTHVTKLGAAFQGATIDSVIIPKTLTDIDSSAFQGANITTITVDDNDELERVKKALPEHAGGSFKVKDQSGAQEEPKDPKLPEEVRSNGFVYGQ